MSLSGELEPKPDDSHELLKALVEASPAAIVSVDPQFRITMWNPAAERMFGWRAEEVLGKPSPIIPDHEREVLAKQLASQFATGDKTLIFLERSRLRKDGTSLEVSVSAAPLVSASGTPRGAVAVLIDATERKAVEAQLRQSQKLDAVGQLAAGVAHEFNNLLTVVRLQTSILLDELAGDDSKRADIKEIQEAAERAAAVTRQLLTFSRQQLVRPEVLDAREVIAQIVPMIRRLIGDDIEVFVHGHSDCTAILDRVQLEQVLLNLVLNARDAMADGGVLSIDTRVITRAQVPDAFVDPVRPIDFVLITVSDTGIGIDDGVRQHIFEPFFTTKGPGRGAGLGLSTVYGIVKQSGGHIAFESAPRSGTTFWILFPHVTEDRAEHLSTRAPVSGGSEAILVVDDDDSVRALVSRILAKQGYTVVTARDGVEAISMLRRRPEIQLVLTDVAMPRINGARLAEYVRATARHIPVLLMSGYPNEHWMRRGSAWASADLAVLMKPFTEAELGLAVRQAMSRPQRNST
jgi:PAS domain S-box-containing protein